MSRTGTGDDPTIEPGGRYFTPAELARACVAAAGLPTGPEATIADTSAGSGAWLDALLREDLRAAREAAQPLDLHRRRLIALDVDPTAAALQDLYAWSSAAHDWMAETLPAIWPASGRVDAIVGNPPYSILQPVLDKRGIQRVYAPSHKRAGQLRWKPVEVATSHVLQDLRRADTVALVLRLSFLEGERWERHPEMWSRLHEVHVIDPRASFDGVATDGAVYALYVWRSTPHAGAPRLLRLRYRKAKQRRRGT